MMFFEGSVVQNLINVVLDLSDKICTQGNFVLTRKDAALLRIVHTPFCQLFLLGLFVEEICMARERSFLNSSGLTLQ